MIVVFKQEAIASKVIFNLTHESNHEETLNILILTDIRQINWPIIFKSIEVR